MAVDSFLDIEDIKGESRDERHRDTIELPEFSWGLSNAAAHAGGGGGGAGKVVFQDLHFVKHVDKASPELFLRCASGQHIKKAILFVRKAGGDPRAAGADFYKVSLEDLLVTSFSADGPGDEGPREQVSMNFGKIQFEYLLQRPDGQTETVSAGWDLVANKKI